MLNNLNKNLEDLLSWIDKNGYEGWDPYDIKGSQLSLAIQNMKLGILGKVIRKFYNIFTELLPNFSRKVLNIKPLENAKGIGLLLTGYSILYKKTQDDIYLKKALECVEWLEINRGKKYCGYNWGYPFDWQSMIFIPKGTPSSVVTFTVGNGYFELYKATNELKYLEVCKQICEFFVTDLNITHETEDTLCHSYTPIDDYQVHNANLFVGAFLSKVGKELKNNDLIARGVKCANFAISEQQSEGFLPYWGLEQTDLYSGGAIKIDHYHCGFEIRMLFSIWQDTNNENIKAAWEKYFDFYLKNLFTKDGLPKITPENYYPVNIHSITEAMLCLGTINQQNKDLDINIKRVEVFAASEMEYKDGEYCYMIRKLPLIGEYKIKIPMLRWGQAWILYAYALNLKDTNER